MSSQSLPSIEIDCRPTPGTRLLAACVLAVIALVPWSVWSGPLALAVAASGLALAAAGFRRSGWWGRCALVSARCAADGTWWLQDSTGREFEARLASGCRVLPSAIWLNWRTPDGRRCTLLAGRAGGADTRRLAVRLRLGLPGPAAPGTP